MEKQYRRPNSLDKYLYGSTWEYNGESGTELWSQSSEDSENPKWRRLGDIYEECHRLSPVDNYEESSYGLLHTLKQLKEIN